MLQAIRDKVTGWIAYGIIFLISIPFALWGVNSYLGGGEALPAATVNGEEIGVRQLDQAYANYRQRLSQLFGGSIPEALGNESVMRAQVLDQLIEDSALRQYVEAQHYRIGDEALGRRIRGMQEFQRDGKFNPEVYQQQLRSLGLSPVGFEQRLRINGAVEQFQNGIRQTAFVTPVARKQFSSLQNQTRKIRTLSYRPDPSSVQVDDSEIEQYYLSNTERYMTPEQVKVDYIELSLGSIKDSIEVDESEIEARYQDNLAAYTTPEFRDASHILITVDEDTDDATALQQVEDIRARIQAGESFAALAKEFSQDPGSAADGGSLGEVGRGEMVPTFEAALFALQPNEISEPVKTGFGWHLIQLHSITGGESRPYESVKGELEDEIKSEKAEVQIYELVERVSNVVYEQPDSLQPAADQFDLRLLTSDWFDRFNGTGIAAQAMIREKAFSDEIKQQAVNSGAIQLDENHVVFMRLNDSRPAQVQSLDQVKDRVKAELISQKLSESSLKAGTEALAALGSGKRLEDVAEEWSTPVIDHGFVGREQADIGTEILRRGFSMAKPEQGPVFDGLSQNGGEYVIIELSAVLSNDDQQEGADNLRRTQAGVDYQSVLQYLGARADVVRTPLDEVGLNDI
jgi:peptidyl-prolyl cis-trans isomerase D